MSRMISTPRHIPSQLLCGAAFTPVLFAVILAMSACSGPRCDDGIWNGHETSLDCGGPECGACAGHWDTCYLPRDCATGYCEPRMDDCFPEHLEILDYEDRLAEGAGGGPCVLLRHCLVRPTCDDGEWSLVLEGNGGGIDCGGSCLACDGYRCDEDDECKSGYCSSSPGGQRCDTAPTCSDGVWNGDEVDVDCGGSCPRCAG